MVEMQIVYEGELRTRSTHGPSGSVIETDAPLDNEGRAERFSPTDLLAASLGTCILTVMGIFARRRGWQLEGARARVEKHMVTAPARRIGRLLVELDLPPLPEDARAPLERVAHGCPVHRSLHPDVEVEIRFRWA
jgi:putative redox protein